MSLTLAAHAATPSNAVLNKPGRIGLSTSAMTAMCTSVGVTPTSVACKLTAAVVVVRRVVEVDDDLLLDEQAPASSAPVTRTASHRLGRTSPSVSQPETRRLG